MIDTSLLNQWLCFMPWETSSTKRRKLGFLKISYSARRNYSFPRLSTGKTCGDKNLRVVNGPSPGNKNYRVVPKISQSVFGNNVTTRHRPLVTSFHRSGRKTNFPIGNEVTKIEHSPLSGNKITKNASQSLAYSLTV